MHSKNYTNWGMHLTQPPPICSIWAWKTTRAHCRNSGAGSRRKKRAPLTWLRSDGLRDSGVSSAVKAAYGKCLEAFSCVRIVDARFRLLPGRSSIRLESLYECGLRRCGMLPTRNMERMRSVCSGFWDLAATTRLGSGFIGSGAQWYVLGATA